MIEYPDRWDPYVNHHDPINYSKNYNLLPSVVLYENGTMITVGSKVKPIETQSDDVDRKIWVQPFRYSTKQLKEFSNVLKDSGFFNMTYVSSPKPNSICYYAPLFINSYQAHFACIRRGEMNSIFSNIRLSFEKIFSPIAINEYVPHSIYVHTVEYNNYKKNVNRTTRARILSEFDPYGLYFRNYYTYETNCFVVNNVSKSSVKTFLTSVNRHQVYSDDEKNTFSFVVMIPELSILSSLPGPDINTKYITSDYRDNPVYPDIDYSYNYVFIILAIIFVVLLIVFIFIAILIRRSKMQKQSNPFNNNLSDESSELESMPQPTQQIQQTSYPIFVQNGNMPYPIFVTNPMQNTMMMPNNTMMQNPMMMPNNTIIQTPIMFPQPTVFYPQNQ